ncbi:golgin subfamily A member 6-like protein 7 [Palaemon carinicauda]|uniref:golgin subfamily A member 6-like protein 7 n=1 Tax=Palaemon carinicauda TaxID=392227 RepID=UPI0035B6753C
MNGELIQDLTEALQTEKDLCSAKGKLQQDLFNAKKTHLEDLLRLSEEADAQVAMAKDAEEKRNLEIAELQEKCSKLTDVLDQREEQLYKKEDELAAKDAIIATAKTELASAKMQVNKTKSENGKLVQTIIDCQERESIREKENKEHKRKLLKEVELKQEKLRNLEEKCAAMESEALLMVEELASIKGENMNLWKEMEKQTEKMNEFKELLSEKSRELEKKEDKLGAKDAAIAAAKTEIEMAQKRVKNMTCENARLHQLVTDCLENESILKRKNEELERTVKNEIEKNLAMRETLRKSEEKCVAKESEAFLAAEELASIRRENANLRKELEKQRELLSEKNHDYILVEAENQGLKQKIS